MASSSSSSNDQHRSLPPISALFLILFDQKVGYTIAWHRELPDTSLDGVEFQSLPSGLHAVKEDLVYFVHGEHAGISAFVQREADDAHRNAEFASVGVLLPLSQGRLGRGWLLAESLREMAREVVKDVKDTTVLDKCWEKSQVTGGEQSGSASAPAHRLDSVAQELQRRAKRRRRSQISSALTDDDRLSPDHPALSVPELLDVFGPLIFPIYRAALLRKRILCLGAAPVQRNCNAVYILSVLASLPPDALGKLPAMSKSLAQIRPLFNVGIHDIPTLSQKSDDKGWLACTTDDILRDKTQLYDLLVEFPSSSSSSGGPRKWPKLLTPDGTQLKATQRDLRRYKLLRLELRRMRLELRRYNTSESSSDFQGQQSQTDYNNADDEADEDNNDDEAENLISRTTSVHPIYSTADQTASSEIVEPVSWAAMAYNSIVWCTSAGEMDRLEAAEIAADRSLLDDLPDIDISLPENVNEDQHGGEEGLAARHKAQASATIVVAYFLRLTALILGRIGEVVEEDQDQEGGGHGESEAAVAEGKVVVSVEDLARIGLDTWSTADRDFVLEAVRTYFGREAVVGGGDGVRICGLRIC